MKRLMVVATVISMLLIAWATQWRYEQATIWVGLTTKRNSLFRINRYTGEVQELTKSGWLQRTPRAYSDLKTYRPPPAEPSPAQKRCLSDGPKGPYDELFADLGC